MRWAFAEESNKPIDIICHVLPVCTYDLILGRKFLAATETLAKYRRRVTECAFSMLNVFHLNLLDDGHQNLELEGRVGDHPTRAAADTGAERNVMDLQYVVTVLTRCLIPLCYRFSLMKPHPRIKSANALHTAMRKHSASASKSNLRDVARCNLQMALSRKPLAKWTRPGPSPPA